VAQDVFTHDAALSVQAFVGPHDERLAIHSQDKDPVTLQPIEHPDDRHTPERAADLPLRSEGERIGQRRAIPPACTEVDRLVHVATSQALE